jgi:hypothetical protein
MYVVKSKKEMEIEEEEEWDVEESDSPSEESEIDETYKKIRNLIPTSVLYRILLPFLVQVQRNSDSNCHTIFRDVGMLFSLSFWI